VCELHWSPDGHQGWEGAVSCVGWHGSPDSLTRCVAFLHCCPCRQITGTLPWDVQCPTAAVVSSWSLRTGPGGHLTTLWPTPPLTQIQNHSIVLQRD